MAKEQGSRIVRLFSRIFKIRVWFDWDRFKANTNYLYSGISRLFVPTQKHQAESFTRAMRQLHLTEDDLERKKKALFRLSCVMLLCATVFLFYGVYQLFWGSIKAFVVSLVGMMLGCTLAFRYHFWYFQIKERRLGCTISEWYHQGLLGKTSESKNE